MASTDERITLTVRVENPLYIRMRDFALKANATHNALMEAALEFYLDHVQMLIKPPSRTEMQNAATVIRDSKP